MVLAFALLFVLFGLAQAQCNYAACRTYCNSTRACFGHACPDVITLGQRVVVFFNWSTARIGWTAGVSPDQLYVETVLDLENYRRMLNNQSYTFDFQSVPRVFSCQIDKGGASQGRGWALVYTCFSSVCDLWHEELAQNELDPCAENCTTGTVGDGVCNPACNVSACAFDLGDCQIRFASTGPNNTNPDQGLFSSLATASSSVRQCFPGCEAQMIGNGICDAECAFPACSYDNGDCEIFNPCAGDPCLNGGTCSVPVGSSIYHCDCAAPYCGPQCQYNTWTQESSVLPTGSFCLGEYQFCQSKYNSFTLCCYGSVSSCTGSSASLASGETPSPPTPAPNSAAELRIWF